MNPKNSSPLQAYTGNEPFLFLCFSDADKRKIRPLLSRLQARGCRIWYTEGRERNLAGQQLRSERQAQASLTVLYNTAAFAADTDAKGALLACQARGCPIVSIDTDTAADELSLGLTGAVHIPRPKNAAAAEEALLHTEHFSQELIGPAGIRGPKRVPLCWIFLILLVTALIAAGGLFYLKTRMKSADEPPADTVFFQDEALTAAVREAAGGGALTSESVSGITELTLTALPKEVEDLSLLPSLLAVHLPQEAVLSDNEKTARLLESYTVFLKGGEE